MAAPACLLADGEQAVRRPRHRAAHEQQIPLRVHLHNLEPQLGEALRAHVSRHPLPLDDARRVRARRDRPGLAVPRVAVGLGAAGEVVAVHDALEAPALGHPRDFHGLARLEDRHRHGLTRLGAASPMMKKLLRTRGAASSPAFFAWPSRAFGVRVGLRCSKPSCTRSPATCTTGHGPASITVTGTAVPSSLKRRVMPSFLPISPFMAYWTLISTSTPAGRSSFVNASTVCGRESRMSMSRLCVFSSNCSRLFLSMCGLRSTVHSDRLVGSGIGPDTCAPVFSAVRTMSAAAWSISAWSNALSRMRILPAMGASYFLILVTTPAPTVRPPSRIANRSPSSIAIGVISSIVIFVLSPGITISTPAANSTVPVTSVVLR